MTSQTSFRHNALVIDSDASVRDLLVPAVQAAMAEADRVVVAVSDATAAQVRSALGATGDALEWSDAAHFRQRLGFAYESFRRSLASAHAAGERLHIFAESGVANGAGLSEAGAADRAAAYLAYEAICNETYAGYGCEVTCLWDARRHPTLVIENARRLHDQMAGPGAGETADVVSPREYLTGRNQVPLELPGRVDWAAVLPDLYGLPDLRQRIASWAGKHGFATAATLDVVMAVNEVATNGLTHGQPPATVSGWRDRDTLLVQVDDQGGIPIPPYAGYVPPSLASASQRGLWLARQLADVVRVNSLRQLTSVRLCFPRGPMHRSGRVAVLSPR